MSEPEFDFDVIVIGGGPAGLTAAIAAAEAGRRVLVFERLQRPGRKLLATGGGRCNLTRDETPKQLAAEFGRRRHFIMPALWGLSPEMLRYWLAEIGIETEADEQGRVYPASHKAVNVLTALMDRCKAVGMVFRCGASVGEIRVDEGRAVGVVDVRGREFSAKAVVLAAGGMCMPKLGSDGSGFMLAEAAGHSLSEPVPALVSLETREKFVADLAGVVTNCRVRLGLKGPAGAPREGELLFTHRGVSGPVILDLSGEVSQMLDELDEVGMRIELVAGMTAEAWREQFAAWREAASAKSVRKLLGEHLVLRLADVVCGLAEIDSTRPLAEVGAKAIRRLCEILGSMELTIVDTAGFDAAMVTRGGVRLGEVNEETLESRIVNGLFFAGEVLDIAGPCGGYNLTWAFASGKLAGESAAG
ncbi:MAG: NAD(P)/FAD-dependent oxidoreductase [Phycisphaerales bacterium]|jgi:predicted Rossmann fold flavoprotein|nr:NAD(P)/FAD-dependent oxidoreductase [Phycisphaerales bacterium]MBT7171530.1 NAD(P)/FAD-dependent oxidoreductase [Phycisphaerales bacterium]